VNGLVNWGWDEVGLGIPIYRMEYGRMNDEGLNFLPTDEAWMYIYMVRYFHLRMGTISGQEVRSQRVCLLLDFHTGNLAVIKLQGAPIQLTRDSHAKAQLQKKNRIQDNIGSRISIKTPACPCLNESRPSRYPSRRITHSTIGPSPPTIAKSRSGPDKPPVFFSRQQLSRCAGFCTSNPGSK
jgi:hypothetical protein